MKSISDKVIDAIKNRGLKSKSKELFLMQKMLIWSIVIILSAMSALTFSIVLYCVDDINTDSNIFSPQTVYLYLLLIFPVIWLLGAGMLMFLGVKTYRSVPRGYRTNFSKIILIYIPLVFVIAYALNQQGVAQNIDKSLASIVPSYTSWQVLKEKVWNQPKHGLIAGRIEGIEARFFILMDHNTKQWEVTYSQSILRHNLKLHPGLNIKIIGEQVSDTKFTASEIRPWQNQRGRRRPRGDGRKRCGQLYEFGSPEQIDCIKSNHRDPAKSTNP